MLNDTKLIVKKLREETLKSNCLYFRISILETISKLGTLISNNGYEHYEKDFKSSVFSGTSMEILFNFIKNEDYIGFHSYCLERESYYKERFNSPKNYNDDELLFDNEWIHNDMPYNECLIRKLFSIENNEITELIAAFYESSYYKEKRSIEVSLLDLFSPDDRTYMGGFADNHFYHLMNDSELLKKILLLN